MPQHVRLGRGPAAFFTPLPPAAVKALAESGIQAEFNGGVLVCANSITVRRGKEEGSVMLEGGLCEEYFRVRDIVYKQFHIC